MRLMNASHALLFCKSVAFKYASSLSIWIFSVSLIFNNTASTAGFVPLDSRKANNIPIMSGTRARGEKIVLAMGYSNMGRDTIQRLTMV